MIFGLSLKECAWRFESDGALLAQLRVTPDLKHMIIVTPPPLPRRMNGAQNYTRTLYLPFQTLVVPSLITESK